MRVHPIIISLVLGFFCIAPVASSSSILKHPFLGIAPKDEKYFQSDTIGCRDGSKKFARAQLNDDFCDCLDATDEPGTSACPGGTFYCLNLGHAPVQLFSSRVNDGICDCCDGSDEYDGTVECPNTCWEAGRVARDKLTKKIATYQEGVTIRKQEIEQAKLDLAKDEADLSKLKSEEKILKGLVQQLKEHKEQIEKAEEQEKEKEKEEKEKKEAEEKANNKEVGEGKSEAVEKAVIKDKSLEGTIDHTIGNVEDSPSEQDVGEGFDNLETKESKVTRLEIHQHEEGGRETTVLPEVSKEDAAVKSESDLDAMSKGMGSPDEVKKVGNDASKDTNGLSSEELGRLVASRWTGENSRKQSEGGDISQDNNHHEDNGEMEEDAYDDDYSDTDDDSSRYGSYGDDDDDVEDDIDDDFPRTHDTSSSYEANSDHESDFSDIDTSSTPTWLEKLQQTVQNMLQAVNLLQTPVDKSEAELVRKEYEESSVKLSKIESKISKLTKKLKLDFGPEREFYSFYGRCFEGRQSKYTYKVCPYKQASQMESYSTTGLGYWDKFDDVNKVMVFANGDKCWNGPNRSLKVKLRCGLKNEITDVDEPSRCEYVALLSTPALCSEEKLKELQGKLESMNKEQPQSHDEL